MLRLQPLRLNLGLPAKALHYKLFSVKAYRNDNGNYDDYNEMINRNYNH